MKTLMLGILIAFGTIAHADSFIRIINKSDMPVQGIWQAIGCMNDAVDWEGDIQLTVCWAQVVMPGKEVKYKFSPILWDRSVKIFSQDNGMIGYCNSMDYASMTILGSKESGIMIESNCP